MSPSSVVAAALSSPCDRPLGKTAEKNTGKESYARKSAQNRVTRKKTNDLTKDRLMGFAQKTTSCLQGFFRHFFFRMFMFRGEFCFTLSMFLFSGFR